MRCSNCSKDIDEEVFPPPLTYCPYCGLKLKDSGVDVTEGMHFCPHCGQELPGKVSFCPYCGGEIGRRATTRHVGVGGEPAEQRVPVIEIPPEKSKKVDKLYKQWVKYADLPPEAIPPKETDIPKPAGQDTTPGPTVNLQRIPLLYIVIGVCIIALIVLIAVVLVQSC